MILPINSANNRINFSADPKEEQIKGNPIEESVKKLPYSHDTLLKNNFWRRSRIGFDKFTNAGYKGLYNGETANDIAKRKGLRYREDILDKMGSVELGANIFRITQTEALLEKQEEPNEQVATNTHFKVGKAVRDTIKKLGGTMPEDLPTPEKSIKEIEKNELKKITN